MRTHREEQRDIPVLGKYDVIVVGGGPAGVGAALAAARSGMKTLVVEQFNCLGGVATAGGHGHISRYDENGTGRLIIGGVALEIATAVESEGAGRRTNYGIWFEVEGLKAILERNMQAAGVDILYHTFFCESILKDGAVAGVVVQSKDGRRAVFAGCVIDCTGDGDVAASAGCAFEIGRPGDHKCQPVTLMFTIGGVNWDRVQEFQKQYCAENPDDPQAWKLERVYAKAQANGDMEPFQSGNMGWWWTPTRPDWVGVNFTHIIHVDTTRAADLTRATIEGRRQAYLTVDVYRKYIPGMETCYMVSTPNTVGLRESRRIEGEHVLNDDEIRNQVVFDDGIAYGSFFVDIHNIDGPGMSPTCWHPPPGFKYQIPYRSLVPLRIDNLLVAGRCVSCTHVALGSIRVMAPCIAMGEAAGAAAAQSLADGVAPRAIDVAKLRGTLRARGAILSEGDIVRKNAVSKE